MQTTIKDRRTGRRAAAASESGVGESFKRDSAANSARRFYHDLHATAQPLKRATICPHLETCRRRPKIDRSCAISLRPRVPRSANLSGNRGRAVRSPSDAVVKGRFQSDQRCSYLEQGRGIIDRIALVDRHGSGKAAACNADGVSPQVPDDVTVTMMNGFAEQAGMIHCKGQYEIFPLPVHHSRRPVGKAGHADLK